MYKNKFESKISKFIFYQVKIFNKLGDIYLNKGEQEKARKVSKRAYNLTFTLNNIKERILALENIGRSFRSIGDFQSSLFHYNKALKVCQKYKKRDYEAYTLLGISANCFLIGDYKKSLQSINRSLGIYERLDDVKGISECYGVMGGIYRNMQNYELALKNFNLCLETCLNMGEKRGTATSEYNIGTVYFYLGEYDKALQNFLSSLKLIYEVNDKRTQAMILRKIGEIKLEMNDYKTSFKYLNSSLDLCNKTSDKYIEALNLVSIADVYFKIKNFNESQKCLENSITLFENLKLLNHTIYPLTYLALIYCELENENEAVKFVQKSEEMLKHHKSPLNVSGIYFNLYKIFSRYGFSIKAELYLQKAYRFINQIVKGLSNEKFVRSFTENVQLNREIIKIWKEYKSMRN